ncbi:MAG: hypothetical protein ABFR89_03945, partial [Actinomycetota bacterium]
MSTMTTEEIGAALTAAEEQIAASGVANLRGVGFWRAVAAVKRDPELVDRFADRIGAIDQTSFRMWAPIKIPMWIGTTLAVLFTVFGLVLIGTAYYQGAFVGALLFLVGTGIILTTTHGLGHLFVGWSFGMRFTVWFAGYGRPQPGVKTDYASYLRTPARSRAWMHASGAIVTKAVPFLLLPSAFMAGIADWAIVVLFVVAFGQIITDLVWSTKSSDWAKFKREMKY